MLNKISLIFKSVLLTLIFGFSTATMADGPVAGGGADAIEILARDMSCNVAGRADAIEVKLISRYGGENVLVCSTIGSEPGIVNLRCIAKDIRFNSVPGTEVFN